MDLNQFREEINQIDRELLELLARRRQVSRKVIQVKDENGLPLRDVQREEELFDVLIPAGRQLELDAHFVTSVFHEIIDDSVRYQQHFLQRNLNPTAERDLRIAYQGVDGAYSSLAARKHFADEIDRSTLIGCSTFAEVVHLVESGNAEYALLPVENTTAGSINEVYDLLTNTKLSIVGEEIFRVEHCLLAIDEVPLSNIRRVFSHPQALAQCKNFISELPGCQREYFADTAMAVQKVRDDRDLSQAAIASEEAGRLYGLKVLRRNLADQPDNFTRFLIVAPEPVQVDPRVPSKTSLVLSTAHQEGALLQALSVLHAHHVNCSKLESRPKRGSPFEYVFYVDVEGSTEEKRVREAIDELRKTTTFLKVLGSYPMQRRDRTRPLIQSIVGSGQDSNADGSKAESSAATSTSSSSKTAPLTESDARQRRTTVSVRDVLVGGDELVVIAGPGMVESEEQIHECARQVKECGGKVLASACFRSSATREAFRPLGWQGLEHLVSASRAYDLPIATPVVDPAEVEKIAQHVDLLIVGARNMHNASLLTAVGKVGRPVLLERGVSASLEEWLHAAEAILSEGNQQVILSERGIRTHETTTRSALDIGAVTVLSKRTHLPIIIDPSRIAGTRDLVRPVTLAARAVEPAGLRLEVHPHPEEAATGGERALDFAAFSKLLREIYRVGEP